MGNNQNIILFCIFRMKCNLKKTTAIRTEHGSNEWP